MSWTIEESESLYNLHGWGHNLFRINAKGHLEMTPGGEGRASVDLRELADQLEFRGLNTPVLLRFPQVAQRRLAALRHAFEKAREESEYNGAYRPVFPIKVNQQADLVGSLVDHPDGPGLEAGSKPELLACAALLPKGRLLICNGYKDEGYLRLALDAQVLGLDVVVVIEKLSEVPKLLKVAAERGVRPRIGVRARLSRPGAGRWRKSSGDRAKFGLSAPGIKQLVDQLREAGYLDCLQLLHFHIGSQVSNIRTFKRALREATRLYVELARSGAAMGTLDVGGGLGVDYDGSRTDFESSMNYTLSEYASDVVSAVADACNEAELPHPTLVTESGRATVAHCSVLLFDVVGVETLPELPPVDGEVHALVEELQELIGGITQKNVLQSWHDARDVRERAHQAFELGVIDLDTLAQVDAGFWAMLHRIRRVAKSMTYLPEELEGLEEALAHTYYGNFSLFQSLPDAWAIGQLFPVIPVQRLHQEPTEHAVIADLTCDSDGRIDRFVDLRDVRKTLPVHRLDDPDESYVMAICLVGAYQEILGDLHNLFGDTHAVMVDVDEKSHRITRVIDGQSVAEVLQYVQYDRRDLLHRIRDRAEASMAMDSAAARAAVNAFRDALDAYTYLS